MEENDYLLLFGLMESLEIYTGLRDGRSWQSFKKLILKYSNTVFFLIHALEKKRKLYILASVTYTCTTAVLVTLSGLILMFQIEAVEALPKI